MKTNNSFRKSLDFLKDKDCIENNCNLMHTNFFSLEFIFLIISYHYIISI